MIDTEYEISVADQFVSVDNDAIFKCQIAPQARDLYAVVGWLEDGQQLVSAAAQSHLSSAAAANGATSGGERRRQQHAGQARATMLPDGSLYIHRARLRDANKSYRCQVRNLLNARLSLSTLSGRLFVTGE